MTETGSVLVEDRDTLQPLITSLSAESFVEPFQ
jgi:hypothetical protein